MYVSDEAYEAFSRYAKANGVTVAALLEQLGLMIGENDRFPSTKAERRLISGARAIVEARQSRKPRPD